MIAVEAGQLIAQHRVRVGEPEIKLPLSPNITTIEVLKDEDNQPLNLKVTGSNFMTYYRFAHYQVNGQPVFGHQTNIVDDQGQLLWETIVHLPRDFKNLPDNQLFMITPFGAAFKTFGGVQ